MNMPNVKFFYSIKKIKLHMCVNVTYDLCLYDMQPFLSSFTYMINLFLRFLDFILNRNCINFTKHT